MKFSPKLTRSIVLNHLGLVVFHALAFWVIGTIWYFDPSWYSLYAAGAGVWAVLVLLFLLGSRKDFYFLQNGVHLEKVNFANQLTLFRITSLPSLVLIFMASRSYAVAIPLLVYTALAFLTDLLDGYISRKTNQTTRVGQYLDSVSDYAVLLAIAFAFAHVRFIPTWFLILVIVRFVSQWVFMFVLWIKGHGHVEPVSSWLGKASVFGTMFVFALGLLRLFPWFDQFTNVLLVFQIAASVVLLISLIEKTIVFFKDLKTPPAPSQVANTANTALGPDLGATAPSAHEATPATTTRTAPEALVSSSPTSQAEPTEPGTPSTAKNDRPSK